MCECNAFFQALFLKTHADCTARKEQNVSSRIHLILFTKNARIIKKNGFIFQAPHYYLNLLLLEGHIF